MKNSVLRTGVILYVSLLANFAFGQNLIEKNWEKDYTFQNSVKNTSMDLDASGDLFVTGHVENGVEGNNIVTLKYDQNGTLLWATQYHASLNDFGIKNECDNAGNVYTLGSVETGGGTTATVLIKYNASGVQQWVYAVALGTSNKPVDLFANSGGHIYILSENIISGQKDAVISVVNSSGSLVNQQTFNSGYEDTPINFDYRSGRILLGVSINNMGTITSSIVRYNPALSPTWAYNFTGSGVDDLKSVKFDNSGNGIALVSVGATKEAQITKISSGGTFQWDVALDDDNTFYTNQSLCIDTLNNIIVAYAHNSEKEISTALIDDTGKKMWNKYYYGNNVDYTRVGVVTDGTRIICGASETNMSVGNMFSFSLDYNANFQWEHREDCGMSGQLSDFDINTNSHIVLTGQKEMGSQYKIALVDLNEKAAYDAPDESGNKSGHLAYFQNLGRIKDLDGNTVDGLSYTGVYGDEALYFFKNSIAFSHYKSDFNEATVDSLYRLDFLFTGDVNPKKPTGINPVNYHNNYYTADLKRERVNGYKKIVYPKLYNNIDLEIGENEFGPVFSFIMYPGADIGDIEWEVDGATELYGGYLDSAIIADFKQFSTPILYTEDPMGDPLDIPYDTTAYGYDIDSTGKIVLDFPTMVNSTNNVIVVQLNRRGIHKDRSPEDNFNWCSYVRNPGKQAWSGEISKIDSDDANNTYYAGNVRAKDITDAVFPTTAGVPFGFPIGGSDITVMKLNDDIEIQWATYYGGTEVDFARSITVDGAGSQIYVTGHSQSTDFPTEDGVLGAYVEGALGESFILQLNDDGTAFWATKFPATLRDCEIVGTSLFVVGARMNAATPSLMDDAFNYYSANGSGYIGVFKAGGIYTHGTGFGSTTGYGSHTDIYGIDSNGATNFAITGESRDPDHPFINAPTNHEYKSAANFNNAFVANIQTNGTIDFSYYISSIETVGGLSVFGGDDLFYSSLGDRGNDVEFSPDGNSIYVVGEVHGDDLYTVASLNPDAYYQSGRYPANNGIGTYRPAGFIYKSEIDGDELFLSYFSASEPIETYAMVTRLEEISFDNLGNYFISGHQVSSAVEDSPIPTTFNIPLPYAQPLGFYQKNEPTNSDMDCVGGLDQESYLIAFNKDDEHIWTTYVGGERPDQLKPIEVTSNNHLYFGGTAQTINLNWPELCPGTTDEQIKEVEFPRWDFDLGSTDDLYNGDGENDRGEFAGRFDVNGINDAGPPLSVNEEDIDNNLLIYPNPLSNGDLFLLVEGERINKVIIYSVDGKIILNVNQIDIRHVNIDKLINGTYIVMCQTDNGSYNSKFIKN